MANLSNIFTYYSTNSLSRDQLSESGLIKNIHYGDIHKKYGCIVDSTKDISTYIKDINYNNRYQICKENDLIFADASEDYEGIGKAIELKNVNNLTIISGLHTILARDENNNFAPKFKGYLFNTPKVHNQIKVLANGFKVFGISKSIINQLVIYIPSKSEQEKISDMLLLLDQKIELQSKKIEVLKLYKKCLLHLLFAGEGKKNILNDICDFINGKGHESFIDEDGKYILVNSKFISTNGNVFKKTNKSLSPLKKDSITMVMSDLPNGKTLAKCFYIEEDNKYTLNQRVCSLFVKDKKVIDSKFLFYLLDRNKNYLKFDDGVNQTNLKKEDVLDIVIRIPKLSYQIDVANILITLDRLVRYEQNKNDVILLLKKGLMQSMFV